MSGLDLNGVTRSASANGDYGVYDPVNAWDGAKDIIVSVMRTGAVNMQIGYEKDIPDTIWVRAQAEGGGEWTAWTSQSPPPPPEPIPQKKQGESK